MIHRAARRVFGMLPEALRRPIYEQRQRARQERLRSAFGAIGAADVPQHDFNHLLHHLRGEALARLPQGARHFVSVGCAGTWYFKWIAEKCKPRHHTGIEFYTPKPGDLPPGVDWIANTAGNMEAVPDASADLLFSGQNIEHLWPHDIANFLLESHRVLEPGGLLVVDSPNRLITARLGWSHPEHTIELTPEEIRELLGLAGFDVAKLEGMWLCETPDGALLRLDDITPGGSWSVKRRIAEALAHPRRSFSWWAEARRADRAPDPEALRRRIAGIHAVAWPERLSRLTTSIGVAVRRGSDTWFDSEGRPGALVFGPYTALPAGRHELTMTVEMPQPAPGVEVRVTAGDEARVLASTHVDPASMQAGQAHEVRVAFELPDTTFVVQFIVVSPAGPRVLAKKEARLSTSTP